jgi:hypothetical protein
MIEIPKMMDTTNFFLAFRGYWEVDGAFRTVNGGDVREDDGWILEMECVACGMEWKWYSWVEF